MSLKFYRFDVNIQIDSCRIQRNFNADATVLPAKPKEKEPALSVCKLFGPAVLRSAFPLADQGLITPFQHLKLCIVHRHSHEKLHLSLLVFRAQMPMVFAAIETTCATLL